MRSSPLTPSRWTCLKAAWVGTLALTLSGSAFYLHGQHSATAPARAPDARPSAVRLRLAPMAPLPPEKTQTHAPQAEPTPPVAPPVTPPVAPSPLPASPAPTAAQPAETPTPSTSSLRGASPSPLTGQKAPEAHSSPVAAPRPLAPSPAVKPPVVSSSPVAASPSEDKKAPTRPPVAPTRTERKVETQSPLARGSAAAQVTVAQRQAVLAALPPQARETLAQIPGERADGLLARLHGQGTTDPREIVVAVYLDCSDHVASGGCRVLHQVLLSASGVALLDWAIESPQLIGTRMRLDPDELRIVDSAGGTDWYIARAWRSSSEELLP